MPSISVIVPVYKVEAYLDRCVSSILRQSLRDFELILVDDGSPDNCGRMCDAWAEKDSRIHVIHQENGGLSAARNTGIDWVFANSDSSWLCFVDSDDWIHWDFLLQLYKAAAETDSRISVCGFYRTAGESREDPVSGYARAITAEEYYCSGQIHGGITAMACNKLYHRSLFKELRFPAGKLHEDEFTTYLVVYAAGKVGVIEEELYAYYQNPQSITQSEWNPKRLDVLEAFEQQMVYAEENGFEGLLRCALEAYIYTIHGALEQLRQYPEYKQHSKPLRMKLRWGLQKQKIYGLFPFEKKYFWVYEDAWPCKVFWWLMSKVR